MDSLGEEFFAGTGLADDQGRDIAAVEFSELADHSCDFRVSCVQLAQP